jgi:hypothetical protein
LLPHPAAPPGKIAFNASQAHHEDKTASGIGYTLANTLPNIAEANVLAVTYYDDYTFPKPANLGYVNTYAVNALSTAKNLQTGARVRMLAGANVWLASATYYDAEYRQFRRSGNYMTWGWCHRAGFNAI